MKSRRILAALLVLVLLSNEVYPLELAAGQKATEGSSLYLSQALSSLNPFYTRLPRGLGLAARLASIFVLVSHGHLPALGQEEKALTVDYQSQTQPMSTEQLDRTIEALKTAARERNRLRGMLPPQNLTNSWTLYSNRPRDSVSKAIDRTEETMARLMITILHSVKDKDELKKRTKGLDLPFDRLEWKAAPGNSHKIPDLPESSRRFSRKKGVVLVDLILFMTLASAVIAFVGWKALVLAAVGGVLMMDIEGASPVLPLRIQGRLESLFRIWVFMGKGVITQFDGWVEPQVVQALDRLVDADPGVHIAIFGPTKQRTMDHKIIGQLTPRSQAVTWTYGSHGTIAYAPGAELPLFDRTLAPQELIYRLLQFETQRLKEAGVEATFIPHDLSERQHWMGITVSNGDERVMRDLHAALQRSFSRLAGQFELYLTRKGALVVASGFQRGLFDLIKRIGAKMGVTKSESVAKLWKRTIVIATHDTNLQALEGAVARGATAVYLSSKDFTRVPPTVLNFEAWGPGAVRQMTDYFVSWLQSHPEVLQKSHLLGIAGLLLGGLLAGGSEQGAGHRWVGTAT